MWQTDVQAVLLERVRNYVDASPGNSKLYRTDLEDVEATLKVLEQWVARRQEEDAAAPVTVPADWMAVAPQLATAQTWIGAALNRPGAGPLGDYCRELIKEKALRTGAHPPGARLPFVGFTTTLRSAALYLALSKHTRNGRSTCVEHPVYALQCRTAPSFATTITSAFEQVMQYHENPQSILIAWSPGTYAPMERNWYVYNQSAGGTALLGMHDLFHERPPVEERVVLATVDQWGKVGPVDHEIEKVEAVLHTGTPVRQVVAYGRKQATNIRAFLDKRGSGDTTLTYFDVDTNGDLECGTMPGTFELRLRDVGNWNPSALRQEARAAAGNRAAAEARYAKAVSERAGFTAEAAVQAERALEQERVAHDNGVHCQREQESARNHRKREATARLKARMAHVASGCLVLSALASVLLLWLR